MSNLEKVGIFAAIVPLLLGVLSGVWYAAVTFNDLSNSLDTFSEEVVIVKGMLTDEEHEHEDLDERVEKLERLAPTYPKLIYVNNNFAVMQASDGSTMRVALYNDKTEK